MPWYPTDTKLECKEKGGNRPEERREERREVTLNGFIRIRYQFMLLYQLGRVVFLSRTYNA